MKRGDKMVQGGRGRKGYERGRSEGYELGGDFKTGGSAERRDRGMDAGKYTEIEENKMREDLVEEALALSAHDSCLPPANKQSASGKATESRECGFQ
jgi:hypothetical protein